MLEEGEILELACLHSKEGSFTHEETVEFHSVGILAFAREIEERSQPKWQTIETAPKDGTVIDLWDSHYKCRSVNASWAYHNWMNGKPVGDKSWGLGRNGDPFCINPTHWMHLPKGPK